MFATYSFSHEGTTYNVEFYYRELYQRLRARVLVEDRELHGLFNKFYGLDPKRRYMVSVYGRDNSLSLQLNIGRLSLKESAIDTQAIYDVVEKHVAKTMPRMRNPWIRVSPPTGMLKKTCTAICGGSYLVNEEGQIGPFTLENLLIAYYREGIKAEEREDYEKIGRSLLDTHGRSMGLRYAVVSNVDEVHKYGLGLPASFDATEIKPPTTFRNDDSQIDYWTCYACARYKMGPAILTRYKIGFRNGLVRSGERTVLSENARGAYTGYPKLKNIRNREEIIIGQNSDFENGDPDGRSLRAIGLKPEKGFDTHSLLSLTMLRTAFVGAGMVLLALAFMVRRRLRRDKKKLVIRTIQLICLIELSIALIAGCRKKPTEKIERQTESSKVSEEKEQSTAKTASLHDAAKTGDFQCVETRISEGADVNARHENGFTPLHYAASFGHKDVVVLLINNGADVNLGKDESSGTPLHCAAENAHIEIINLLLEKGADINANNDRLRGRPVHIALNNGHKNIVKLLVAKGADIGARNIQHHSFTGTTTALHEAVKAGDIKRVRALISAGAVVNAKERYGYTPLHYAAWCGHENIAAFLLNNGADVNAATWLGDTPLHSAVERHQIDIAALLISKGADVNAIGNYGRSPLHHAARLGNKSLTELLLAHGADVNASDEGNHSPLNGAAHQGYTEVAKILISNGADVNWENRGARPPLFWAVQRNQREVIELLIANGAVTHTTHKWGETLLHEAAQYGSREAAEVLLKNGADINAKDDRENTPLRTAIFSRHDTLAAFLISQGAGIMGKDKNSETLLHLAGDRSSYALVELLISKGADVNTKDREGETPLHEAAKYDHKKMVKLLLDHGADIHAKTKKGQTPLDLARARKHRDIVELLTAAGAKPSIANETTNGKKP